MWVQEPQLRCVRPGWVSNRSCRVVRVRASLFVQKYIHVQQRARLDGRRHVWLRVVCVCVFVCVWPCCRCKGEGSVALFLLYLRSQSKQICFALITLAGDVFPFSIIAHRYVRHPASVFVGDSALSRPLQLDRRRRTGLSAGMGRTRLAQRTKSEHQGLLHGRSGWKWDITEVGVLWSVCERGMRACVSAGLGRSGLA